MSSRRATTACLDEPATEASRGCVAAPEWRQVCRRGQTAPGLFKRHEVVPGKAKTRSMPGEGGGPRPGLVAPSSRVPRSSAEHPRPPWPVPPVRRL